MNKKLVALTKQRTELSIALIVLQDELHDAPMLRKFEIAREIAFNRGKLHDIVHDIEVATLDAQWEQECCDKPITVIGG